MYTVDCVMYLWNTHYTLHTTQHRYDSVLCTVQCTCIMYNYNVHRYKYNAMTRVGTYNTSILSCILLVIINGILSGTRFVKS